METTHRLLGQAPQRKEGLFFHVMIAMVFSWSLVSCQSMDPRNVDVELPETLPQTKVTSYTEALSRLGDMTEIYASDAVKLQSNPIRDNTGASQPTGGEIPRDITEMIITSLNSIGGRVTFIPYDPAFVQNQTLTGYSNFENKLIPNLVLSGGITEFDRGLATRAENTDVSLEYEVGGIPDALPSKNIGARYADEAKYGLARITLDFNLLDFKTLSGIPKINAVNTMQVLKAVGERELGISLFGQSFGLKGSIKKVQGRHGAVRLLVELSMIQMIGKYLAVPYWRLLGEDAVPDPVVLQAVARYYTYLPKAEVNNTIQQWLAVYGYDMELSDELDIATKTALAEIDPEFTPDTSSVSLETFKKVYLNMPLTVQALKNRKVLQQRLIAQAEKKRQAAATSAPTVVAPSPVPTGMEQPEETAPNAEPEIILTQPAASPAPVETVGQKQSPQITPREPVTQSPTPVAEFPTPVAESPTPVAESPIPVAESPTPVAESPTPVAESPTPVAESPTPVAESPTPVAESPTSTQQPAKEPKQYVEQQVPAPPVLQPIIRTGIGRFLSEEEWK